MFTPDPSEPSTAMRPLEAADGGDASPTQDEARLSFEARWCEALVESSLDAIVSKTVGGIVTSWNRKAEDMFGWSAREMIGGDLLRIFPPDRADEEQVLLGRIQRGESVGHFDTVRLRRDGRPIWVSAAISPIRDLQGRVVGASSILRDISARIEGERELRARELRYRGVLDASPDGFMLLDATGRVAEVNPAYCRMSGYASEELVGMGIGGLDAHASPEDIAQRMAGLKSGGYDRFESVHRRRDGSPWPVEITVSHIAPLDELFVFVRDITERRAIEAERARTERMIRDLAFHDPLTQLPNRRLLLDRLGQALAGSERSGQFGALLFIDMDRFKALNDSLGHEVGDRFLVQVGQRLSAAVRSEDTVARLGGDEFVVMLVELGWSTDDAVRNVSVVGGKLLESLTLEYRLGAHVYGSTPSIGAALFNGTTVPAHALVSRADAAMYRVKSTGGNGFELDLPA